MFKRSKCIIAFASFTASLLLSTCFAFAANKTGTVLGDNLNIRETPSTSAKVLDQLSKGTQVTVLSASNGWVQISFDNIKGWVSDDYLKVQEAAPIGTGSINGSNVNMRQNPDTNSGIITKLQKGDGVSILDSTDDWYEIESGGNKGWVFAEYVTVKDQTLGAGTVNADSVNVRAAASTDAAVVTQLDSGDGVSILDQSGDWYKVKTGDNVTGWIYKSYVSTKKTTVSRGAEDAAPKDVPKQESVNENSSTRQKVVAYARQFMGVRYVYGGSSPKGFDCSGFTSYVFSHFGIKLERVSTDQATQGTKVKKSQLQPGDLVFFDTNGGSNRVNHAGIYIGGGQFIHASSGRSTKRVTISGLNEGFYENAFMTARRVIQN